MRFASRIVGPFWFIVGGAGIRRFTVIEIVLAIVILGIGNAFGQREVIIAPSGGR